MKEGNIEPFIHNVQKLPGKAYIGVVVYINFAGQLRRLESCIFGIEEIPDATLHNEEGSVLDPETIRIVILAMTCKGHSVYQEEKKLMNYLVLFPLDDRIYKCHRICRILFA